MIPRAKRKETLVERLETEVLVYDLSRHRGHCLSITAAMVWERCDGASTLHEIAARIHGETGTSIHPDGVRAAVERLQRAKLLEEEEMPQPWGELDRRRALGRMAAMGLALPSVLTMVAPVPAQAATGITPRDCRNNAPASLGSCCTNGKLCIQMGRRARCRGARC